MDEYVAKVVQDEDTGELLLEFPIDLLEKMGWDEGTVLTLDWIIDERQIVIKGVKDAKQET